MTIQLRGADSVANSGALAKSLQISTKAARLFYVTAFNNSGATLYLQLFDSATQPDETTVPKLVVPILAQTTGGFDFANARNFTNGIYACASTDAYQKTLDASNDFIIDAGYQKQ